MIGTPPSRRDLFVTGATLLTAGTLMNRGVHAQPPSPVSITFRRGGLFVVPKDGKAMTVAYPNAAASSCCHVPSHMPVLSFDSASVEATVSGTCKIVADKIELTGEFELQNLDGATLDLVGVDGAFGKRKHPIQPWTADGWASFRWVPVLNGRLSPNALHPDSTATAPTASQIVASVKLPPGKVTGGAPLDPADSALWRPRDRQHNPKKLDARAITDTLVYTGTAKTDTVILKLVNGNECSVTLKSRTAGGLIELTVAGGPPPLPNEDNSFEPGGQLTHFCNFYRFVSNVPEADQFVPAFAGTFWNKPTPEVEPNAEGLPGRFCPGAMIVV
jgi:hypothetical protein